MQIGHQSDRGVAAGRSTPYVNNAGQLPNIHTAGKIGVVSAQNGNRSLEPRVVS